ncbi:MAG: metal-sulfur cluster assembly factor [Bacillaceae bacterium]
MNRLIQAIQQALEQVVDPELGVDIINLGLVYDIKIENEECVRITMTMTSMGCPYVGQIITDTKYIVQRDFPTINHVEVDIVWTPQWTKEKMSRYAKIALGIHD